VKLRSLRIVRIAAEDEIEGLAQRSNVDLGRAFVKLLHHGGRQAADRWLARDPDAALPMRQEQIEPTHEVSSFDTPGVSVDA
jgi:NTE family protein